MSDNYTETAIQNLFQDLPFTIKAQLLFCLYSKIITKMDFFYEKGLE